MGTRQGSWTPGVSLRMSDKGNQGSGDGRGPEGRSLEGNATQEVLKSLRRVGLPGLIGTSLKMMLETLPKASKEEAILGRALQA